MACWSCRYPYTGEQVPPNAAAGHSRSVPWTVRWALQRWELAWERCAMQHVLYTVRGTCTNTQVESDWLVSYAKSRTAGSSMALRELASLFSATMTCQTWRGLISPGVEPQEQDRLAWESHGLQGRDRAGIRCRHERVRRSTPTRGGPICSIACPGHLLPELYYCGRFRSSNGSSSNVLASMLGTYPPGYLVADAARSTGIWPWCIRTWPRPVQSVLYYCATVCAPAFVG